MVPWCIVDCFGDIDDTLFSEVLGKHAPIKKVKIRGRPSPYITDEIRHGSYAFDFLTFHDFP